MEARSISSDERRQARRVALVSFLAALGLVAVKLAAGLASGSLALLSEAAHSGLDAGATALTFLAVAIARRPPDRDHPYGHGKAENLSALIQTVALLILSVTIAREALDRLRGGPVRVEAAWYAFAVVGLSIAVDASRARLLRRAARRLRSPALQADALNFTADVLTSLVVLGGLVLVRLGYPAADAVGGLVIAAYVAIVSLRLARHSIDVLMDRAPADAIQRIGDAAAAVEGVEEVRRVRLRYAGGDPQADVVVAISRTVPLEIAHHLTEEIEEAIRSAEPGADVVVHVEPLADERLAAERVMSIAARHSRVRQVHNVFVAHRPDGLHISLHAKFPGSMPLREAHDIAERLEREIADELDGVARVDTHLEPLEGTGTLGADATSGQRALVQWATALAERQPEVENCHEVVVTDTEGGLTIVMHCEASPGLSVNQVHEASTRIESEVHRHWPEVERVTVHFEPVGA